MNEYHLFRYEKAETAKISEKCSIGPFTKIEDYVLMEDTSELNGIIIGSRCKIKQGTVMRTYGGHIHLGNRVSIGEYCILAGHGGISIGDNSVIGGMCYMPASNHVINEDIPIRFQGEKAEGIVVGKNVWIGGSTMILDGVRLGDGCVIGAKSLVTKDMPPDTVCYGSPCRPIRPRNSDEDHQ